MVLQSLVAGASVSRIARTHDVNANQVFAWRKAFNEGRLGGTSGTDVNLIPITLTKPSIEVPVDNLVETTIPTGSIELEIGKAKLRIVGTVNDTALIRILDHLLR